MPKDRYDNGPPRAAVPGSRRRQQSGRDDLSDSWDEEEMAWERERQRRDQEREMEWVGRSRPSRGGQGDGRRGGGGL